MSLTKVEDGLWNEVVSGNSEAVIGGKDAWASHLWKGSSNTQTGEGILDTPLDWATKQQYAWKGWSLNEIRQGLT